MPELLSICIPTYNRASYLGDLLAALERALAHAGAEAGDIRVYVSDNASTDATPAVIAEFAARLPLTAYRNAKNIGADRNFEQLIRRSSGVYFWLIGDDDLLVEEVLPTVLAQLRPQTHGLVLFEDRSDDPVAEAAAQAARPPAMAHPAHWGYPAYAGAAARVARPPARTFANYAAFVAYHRQADPWALIATSLISKNAVKRTSYNSAVHLAALETEDIFYAFMYALAEGLDRSGESILSSGVPAVVVREVGAGRGLPPWIVRRLWRRYYEWLGRRYDYPELTRYGGILYGPQHQFRAWRKKLEKKLGLIPLRKQLRPRLRAWRQGLTAWINRRP